MQIAGHHIFNYCRITNLGSYLARSPRRSLKFCLSEHPRSIDAMDCVRTAFEIATGIRHRRRFNHPLSKVHPLSNSYSFSTSTTRVDRADGCGTQHFLFVRSVIYRLGCFSSCMVGISNANRSVIQRFTRYRGG